MEIHEIYSVLICLLHSSLLFAILFSTRVLTNKITIKMLLRPSTENAFESKI